VKKQRVWKLAQNIDTQCWKLGSLKKDKIKYSKINKKHLQTTV